MRNLFKSQTDPENREFAEELQGENGISPTQAVNRILQKASEKEDLDIGEPKDDDFEKDRIDNTSNS